MTVRLGGRPPSRAHAGEVGSFIEAEKFCMTTKGNNMNSKIKNWVTATLVAFAGMFTLSAVADNVAKIDDTEYESIDAAIAAAGSNPGCTIQMIKGSSPLATVESSTADFTLDLNGQKVTSSASPAFSITGGKVKITDSGTGGSLESTAGVCLSVYNGGGAPEVNIDGGLYKGNNYSNVIVSTAAAGFAAPSGFVTSGRFAKSISDYFVNPISVLEVLGANDYYVHPNWLCLTAEEAGSTVAMKVVGTVSPLPTLKYSLNGTDWFTFEIGTTTINLANVGDRVFFRGDNETFNGSSGSATFDLTGKIAASGNVMSLLSKDCSKTEVPAYGFINLFASCTALTTAPELPATVLGENCYGRMFRLCSELNTVVSLPAAEVPAGAYEEMFRGCSKLTEVRLGANTIVADAAKSMFQDCSALTTLYTALESLNTQTGWFTGASATGTFYAPFELDDAVRGADTVPAGWVVRRPNYLSFTARGGKAKVAMQRTGNPDDFTLECADSPTATVWTAFTPGVNEIELNTNQTVYIRRAGADARFYTLSRDNKNYWQFKMTAVDVGATIQAGGRMASLLSKYGFVDKVGEYGFYKLFADCTILTTSPVVPADITADNCCVQMFNGCSALKRIEVNFSDFEGMGGSGNTAKWVSGVPTTGGIFVGPIGFNKHFGAYGVNTVPGSTAKHWTLAERAVVGIPVEIPNATYKIKLASGDEIVPAAGGFNGTNFLYTIGKSTEGGSIVEQLVVELTPASGYTYDAVLPVILPFTDGYNDLYPKLPQPKKALWRVTNDSLSTDNLFGSLSWALADLHDGSTMTAVEGAEQNPDPIPCDCEFIIRDVGNVYLDFNGRDIATNRIYTLGQENKILQLKNAKFTGKLCMAKVELNLSNSTVTDDSAALIFTNACVLSSDRTDFNNIIVNEGEPRAVLLGLDTKLTTGLPFVPNVDIVAYPEDLMVVKNDNIYSVVEAEARIGRMPYETLEKAIAEVQAGETITLLRDIVRANQVKVERGFDFTIDFGGFTHTCNYSGTTRSAFQILAGSDVTFTNGTLKSVNGRGISVTSSRLVLENEFNVITPNRSLYVTDDSAVSGSIEIRKGATVNTTGERGSSVAVNSTTEALTNTVIVSGTLIHQHPEYPAASDDVDGKGGNIIINDGANIVAAGVAIKKQCANGAVALNGGVIYGNDGVIQLDTGDFVVPENSTVKASSTNDCLNFTTEIESINVSIAGGTFTSSNGLAIADTALTKFVSGGFYNTPVLPKEYCADGYVPVCIDTTDINKYTVRKEEESGGIVMNVGTSMYFEKMQLAYSDAKSGDTLLVLSNFTEYATFDVNKNVLIDLNDKGWSAPGLGKNSLYAKAGMTVISNGTFNGMVQVSKNGTTVNFYDITGGQFFGVYKNDLGAVDIYGDVFTEGFATNGTLNGLTIYGGQYRYQDKSFLGSRLGYGLALRMDEGGDTCTVVAKDTIICQNINTDPIKEYDNFDWAVTQAEAGDTLQFVKSDYVVTSTHEINKNLIIDFNQKTVGSTAKNAFSTTASAVVFTNGSIRASQRAIEVKGGTVTLTKDLDVVASLDCFVYFAI